MSCTPTPCPPATPASVSEPTWSAPTDYACLGGGFYNTPQTYIDSCPFGSPTDPISVTIPGGTYLSDESQEAADDLAMAAAQAEAATLRALTPCVIGDVLLLSEDDNLLITEDGNFITLE